MPPRSLSQGSVARRSSVPPRPAQQSRLFERGESAHDRRGVARDNPGRRPSERACVTRLGHEGVTGDFVLLAALDDEGLVLAPVDLRVGGADPLGRAVHHDIDRRDQVVQIARHRETGPLHRQGGPGGGAVEGETHPGRKTQAPVGADVGDAHEDHVVLLSDGGGHALADHAVSIYPDADNIRVNHDRCPRPLGMGSGQPIGAGGRRPLAARVCSPYEDAAPAAGLQARRRPYRTPPDRLRIPERRRTPRLHRRTTGLRRRADHAAGGDATPALRLTATAAGRPCRRPAADA